MLLRNARTATPTSSTSKLLRPGLGGPWSRLINRIPMMFHPIRIIIRNHAHGITCTLDAVRTGSRKTCGIASGSSKE